MAAIFTEIFGKEYKLNLTDDNSFIAHLTDLSSYVIGEGQVLHIPNMDFTPTVLKGLGGDGAFTTTATTETKQTLQLERYYIEPYRVPLSDTQYASYDKVTGVAKQMANKIVDYIHTDVLINIAKQIDTTRLLSTNGTTGSGNSPSGGNKKMLKLTDIAKVAKAMDKDKVGKNNRFIIINPEMAEELSFSTDNIAYQRTDFMGNQALPSGVTRVVAGVNIIVRAEIPVYDGTSGFVPQGGSFDSNDSYCAIAFQSDEVAFALGALNILEDQKNAWKFADIVSMENYMFAGSTRITTKRVGLYGLKQG